MDLKKLIIIIFAVSVQIHSSIGGEMQEKGQVSSNSPIDRSSHHHHETPKLQGIWKKNFIWKPRWVKTWQEKKIYVAVWKRMWGPAEVKEWVPIPKPPPGWFKSGPGNYFVKKPH